MDKNFKFLNYKGIIAGFEAEAVFKNVKRDFIVSELKKIHPKIVLGEDCSICPNREDERYDSWYQRVIKNNVFTGEIKTPPLQLGKSLKILHEVFVLINKFGYTNNSCGFHISISPLSNQRYYRLNPLKFAINPLWIKLVKSFKRERNGYCLNPFKLKKGSHPYNRVVFNFRQLANHHTCVNFENYSFGKRTKYSRIEIRGFGNTGYEKKLDKIKYFLNKIVNLFVLCSNESLIVNV